MRIYVASSWRNPHLDQVVQVLRAAGHEVYDFREEGFGWHEIDPAWQSWSRQKYREMLDHPQAQGGFHRDISALNGARAVVLVTPCGRSAHLELGYAIGNCVRSIVLLMQQQEAELMYKMADEICLSIEELVEALRSRPAVECDEHGVVELSREQYERQMNDPDQRWTCPKCARSCAWAGTGDYE